MTEEDTSDQFGDIDWGQMEYLANNDGSVEGGPETEGHAPLVLNTEMIIRRALWDTIPCGDAVAVANYLELPATSDDVEKMEHEKAHVRLDDISNIAPLIYALSDAAARAIVGAMVVAGGDQESIPLNGDVYNEAYEKFQPVAYTTALSVVAELIDIGLVHTPHLAVIEVPDQGFES